METELLALKLGWTGMLLGVISGAIMGLFFHNEDWLGGYAAHARRFGRLGHISFFGIGLITLTGMTPDEINIEVIPPLNINTTKPTGKMAAIN